MKTIEVKIIGAEFRSKCHYRLKIDHDGVLGGHTTGWSAKSTTPEWPKAILLNQRDNKKRIIIVIEAMVKGEAKELAEAIFEGDPTVKAKDVESELPIGTLKISFKQIKQNVLETCSMAANNKSILGFSIAASVYGVAVKDNNEALKFEDIKIKLRDSNSTVLGHGKFSSSRATSFIQLYDAQVKACESGECTISLSGDGVNHEFPLNGGVSTFVVPMIKTGSPASPLIITTQLISDESRMHGVIHDLEVTFEHIKDEGDEDIESAKLNSPELECLKQPQLMYMSIPGAKSKDNESILAQCTSYPYTFMAKSAVGDDAVDGSVVYTIVPKIDPESRNEDARLNARMLASHRNSINFPPEFVDNGPIEIDCAFVDVCPTLNEVNGSVLDSKITAKGCIKEVKRVAYGKITGPGAGATIVLEGDFDLSDSVIANNLSEKNIKLSARVVITVAPSSQFPEEDIAFEDSEAEPEPEPVVEPEPEPVAEETEKDDKEEEKVEVSPEPAPEPEIVKPLETSKSTSSMKSMTKIPSTVSASKEALETAQSQTSLKAPIPSAEPIVQHQKELDDSNMSVGDFGFPGMVKSKSMDPILKERRANHPEEMPGMSVLEDLVHQNNMTDLYNSFGELYAGRPAGDFSPTGERGKVGEGFSPKQMLAHKRSTQAGQALAHVIKAELVEKQRLINRLMDEAANRSDAIELCGKEIRTLRDDVDRYRSKAQDATTEIAGYEKAKKEASKFVETTVGSPEELVSLNRATLIHVVLDLGERLKKIDVERVELKKIAMEGQAARSMYVERQQQLNDLTEAHMHQSHFIQKLQKKVSKMDNYKSTIKLQENIIAKMQRVVEAHLKLSRRSDSSGSSEQNELFDKLMNEIERAESDSREEKAAREQAKAQELAVRTLNQELLTAKRDLSRAQTDVQTMKEKLKNAEDKALSAMNAAAAAAAATPAQKAAIGRMNDFGDNAGAGKTGDPKTARRVEELEVELTSSRYRIEALESNLETQAQDAGREIARLRTRLFDFEMAAMLSESADQGGFNFDGGSYDFEGDDFIKSLESMPAGGGLEAAQSLKNKDPNPETVAPEEEEVKPEASPVDEYEPEPQPETEKDKEKEEWHEHEEVTIPMPLKSKKQNVGQCELTFKFRYFGVLGAIMPEQEMEIIVTKINLLSYTMDDSTANKKLFCDVSFGDNVFTAQTKPKDVTGEAIIWDYNNEDYGHDQSTLDETDENGIKLPFNHQTRFKASFSTVSSENFLIVCMIENTEEANILLGSGHCKMTHLDAAQEAAVENPDPSGADEEKHDEDEEGKPISRPVPTGKLKHNMAILNSAIRTIGKVMAYADDNAYDSGGGDGSSKSKTGGSSVKSGGAGSVKSMNKENTGKNSTSSLRSNDGSIKSKASASAYGNVKSAAGSATASTEKILHETEE